MQSSTNVEIQTAARSEYLPVNDPWESRHAINGEREEAVEMLKPKLRWLSNACRE